jgi:sterol desaturase/sphingolipid hydroxylase (fatty acid hydroxylase superfamily)
MNLLIADNSLIIRLAAFFAIFLIMATWEGLAPRRTPKTTKARRWPTNLSLTVLNSLVSRTVLLLPGIGLALSAEAQGWGILNRLNLPPPAGGAIAIVVLDLTIYLQHLVFHKIPLFWPLHGLHHTDLDIDVTTGTRFHPLEIALSLLIKAGMIVLVGVPAWAFLLFEILLNGTSLFNHGNVRIPIGADRLLRLFLVTPDMHRVHHSVIIRERDSNFGFNLSWWDRLFRTYRDQPEKGHAEMVIGLANFRNPRDLTLPRLLALPFSSWRKF